MCDCYISNWAPVGFTEEPPVTPHLGFVKTPVWDQADEDTKEAFPELAERVSETVKDISDDKVEAFAGDVIKEAELPELFNEAHGWLQTIMEADLASSFAHEYETGRDKLSAVLREMIERGRKVLAVDYNQAVDGIEVLNSLLNPIFEQFDAILTPAATGEAPVGLDSTGSPTFCTIWTLCGMPAISVPILQGSSGMPIGVQVVGAKGDDARLLRTARWLVDIAGK